MFKTIYGNISSYSGETSFYTEQYNKTISASNCNIDTQMIYLDQYGNLEVVANIYSLAGAESYYHVINIY